MGFFTTVVKVSFSFCCAAFCCAQPFVMLVVHTAASSMIICFLIAQGLGCFHWHVVVSINKGKHFLHLSERFRVKKGYCRISCRTTDTLCGGGWCLGVGDPRKDRTKEKPLQMLICKGF
jgi:hypothetical protein